MLSLTRWWPWLYLAWALPAVSAAGTEETDIVQHRRSQQAILEMARDLVGQVLDVQLTQFSENHLETLPVYEDIRQMRSNLDRLAEKDMRGVVELLTRAQQAVGGERMDVLTQARREARHVAAALMSERERLRARMQVAKLHAQVRQLIERQTSVRERTRRLPEVSRQQRDVATLTTLEDQRDAHVVFQHLVETMEGMQRWENEEGKLATRGLAVLREQQTESWFDAAERNLQQGDIDRAASDQSEIMKRLTELLTEIDQLRGIRHSAHEKMLEEIEELLERQRALTDETAQADVTDQDRLDGLSDIQRTIRQQITQLRETIADVNESELAGQAESAAQDAETALFQAEKSTAVAHQQRVAQRLDELRKQLLSRSETADGESESGAMAGSTALLEQLEAALEELEVKQAEVVEDVEARPERAEELQQEVAQALREQSEQEPLPAAVQEPVKTAADKAEQAAQTLQEPAPGNAAGRMAAAREAQQALQAARAATADQLQASRAASSADPSNVGQRSLPPNADTSERQMAGGQREPGDASADSADADGQAPAGRPSVSERVDSDATASQRRVDGGRRADGAPGDIATRAMLDSPWFARLPPQVREAIRVRARGRPPRGYEEKLRRYFERVDRRIQPGNETR